jgi:putative transposase
MPRLPRSAPGGFAYHVLNRANGKVRLFKKDEDYLAFERVLAEASPLFTPVTFIYARVTFIYAHLYLRPSTC